MSQSSKQLLSGLRSVKRDFSSSSSSILSTSQDTAISSSDADSIPWKSTPPRQLAGIEKRLKDIQDALNENLASSQRVLSSSQAALGKRPAHFQDEPAKRRRLLPSSWTDTAPQVSNSKAHPVNSLVVPASSTSNAVSKPAQVLLSHEQRHILQLVEEGHSIFYTGSAGTGKSVLLREIIKTLRRKYSRSLDAIAVTASTGIAACNIGGVTIHSFAGIGLGRETAEQLAIKVHKNKKATTRWLRTQVLIIDEVSMVEGDLFDKLARIGSLIRKKVEPFGGIQVIVTGDFFQLPPVARDTAVKFAFEGEMWSQTIKKTFNLTKVFRQKDPEFVDILNEMRFGRLTQKSIDKFKSLSREIIYEDGLGATELFPRREDVERSNTVRMSGIEGTVHLFQAVDGGMITDKEQRNKLLSNFMAPETLKLKIGAQVMLIKNLDETLVNGSIGMVVAFEDPSNPAALVDLDDPYAEKSQSKPASKVGKDAGKPTSKGTLLPVVDFLIPGGLRRRVMVQSEVFKVEQPNGEVQASRTQLPLILSWALSIHKSQGQTLERVKVDLARVFEKGQAYVALSRATSLNGLQVLNFNPKKVTVHPKVVEWTRTLETVPVGDQ